MNERRFVVSVSFDCMLSEQELTQVIGASIDWFSPVGKRLPNGRIRTTSLAHKYFEKQSSEDLEEVLERVIVWLERFAPIHGVDLMVTIFFPRTGTSFLPVEVSGTQIDALLGLGCAIDFDDVLIDD